MLKKTLALLLALTLLALTACTPPASTESAPPQSSASTATSSPTVAPTEAPEAPALDPYEITYYMYSIKASDQDAVVEEAINKIIQPKFNATINFIMVAGSDWDTKALVPLRAGEKIDIFWTPEWMFYMANIANGSLMKLNDESGPYGSLIAPYPQTISDLGAFIPGNMVDGNVYAISIKKELCVPGGLMWNQEYVDKYGIDIATVDTYEEIEPYLVKYKEENPQYYPWLTSGGWSFASPFIQGYLNNMNSISMFIGEPGATDGEPVIVWEQDAYKKNVEWMGKWFEAGYIHPDAQLKTFSTSDLMYAGQFLVSDMVLKGGQVKAKELMSSSGNTELKLIEQQTSASVIVTTHLGGAMLGIPVSSKDPERAMMYLNEMYQNDEIINLMAWGVEGVHYTLDDQGRAVQKDMNGWSDSHGGKWTIGNQFKQYVSSQEDPEKYQQMQALTDEAWMHESVGFRFKQDDYANEYTAAYSVQDSQERPVNTGVNAKGLEAMIQGYKDAGVKDVVLPAVEEAYAKWKADQMAKNPNFPALPN